MKPWPTYPLSCFFRAEAGLKPALVDAAMSMVSPVWGVAAGASGAFPDLEGPEAGEGD